MKGFTREQLEEILDKDKSLTKESLEKEINSLQKDLKKPIRCMNDKVLHNRYKLWLNCYKELLKILKEREV